MEKEEKRDVVQDYDRWRNNERLAAKGTERQAREWEDRRGSWEDRRGSWESWDEQHHYGHASKGSSSRNSWNQSGWDSRPW